MLWDALAKETEERIFERTGVINLGPARSEFLANVERSAKAFNLEVEKLDAPAITARWPEITVPDDYIASLKPTPGCCTVKPPSKPGSTLPPKRAVRNCLTVRWRPSRITQMA